MTAEQFVAALELEYRRGKEDQDRHLKSLLSEWLTLWLNSGPDPEGIEELIVRTRDAIECGYCKPS